MIRNWVELGIAAGSAIQLTDRIAANLSGKMHKDVVCVRPGIRRNSKDAHAIAGRQRSSCHVLCWGVR